MTDAHTPRVLSDADSAADLAGLPRPVGQMAKIMALVERYSFLREHGTSAEYDKAGSAVEAALRDAPQQAEPPEIDYEALIAACYKRTKAAQGTKGCVQFAAGAEWYREQIAARPSAPTAVEPLFAAMIAQHPGLREEIAADAERSEFEAWARSADYQSIVDDSLDCPLGRALWQAWQARASKGTK